jgi:hypothetical protein
MKTIVFQSIIILFCQTLIFAQVRDIWQTPTVVVKTVPTGNDIAFTVRVVKNDMGAVNQRFSVRFPLILASRCIKHYSPQKCSKVVLEIIFPFFST